MEQKKITDPNSITSRLQYHGYVALIVHIDGEKYFRNVQNKENQLEPFEKTGDILSYGCAKYRRAMAEYLEAFKKANKHEEGKNNGKKEKSECRIETGQKNKDDEEPTFEKYPYLYNPASFIAFGNNDNISVVLSDDFEFEQRLVMLSNVPARQTSLAFCPELESLGLKDKNFQDIFCEPSDICNGAPPVMPDNELQLVEIESKGALQAPIHPFVEERPLVAVTYFKLNGMAVLGPGLLLQEAVYRVMAKKIRDAWIYLERKTNLKRGTAKTFFTKIMSNQDVQSFQCAFLEPQGWADVATLMFCRNYSVIATILATLRCITLNDLYQLEGFGTELKNAIKSFGLHEEIAQAAQINGDPDVNPLLSSNHAFCSTYTTLAMSHKAWAQDEASVAKKPYNVENNFLIADTSLNLSCGHFVEAQAAVVEEDKFKAPYHDELLKSDYLWYMVGYNDFLYQQLLDPDFDVGKAVQLFELVKQIKAMRAFPLEKHSKCHSINHIYESSSTLRIPIPLALDTIPATSEGIKLPRLKNDHVEIRDILDETRRRLFENDNKQEEKGSTITHGLNIKHLYKKLKKLRVPLSVTNAIIYLFDDFATYLSDSYLFDGVLDLYDIFAALYHLLTDELPELLDKRIQEEVATNKVANDYDRAIKIDFICRSFLDDGDIDNLSELAKILQNALTNKVQIAFEGAERWNMSIDVRGLGLNRILNAADAPLKCGLGVLRRVMNHWEEEVCSGNKSELSKRSKFDINKNNRKKIGAVSTISCNPSASLKRLNIGDTLDFFLSSVNFDVAHLTRPRAFHIQLHEIGHLICQFLKTHKPCKEDKYKHCPAWKNCHKRIDTDQHKSISDFSLCYANIRRYEEIFSEVFVHKFIFESDPTTYYRNYVAYHLLDPIVYLEDDYGTFKQLFEMLMRGFLASEPFRNKDIYTNNVSLELTDEMVDSAFKRFEEAVEDAGPFFFDFDRLWKVPEDRIKIYFNRTYKESFYPICCIWEDISKIYDTVYNGELNEENERCSYSEHIKELDDNSAQNIFKMIENGIKFGKPLVRVLYNDSKFPNLPEENRLDPFFLIRHLLRIHITRLYGKDSISPKELVVCFTRKDDGGPYKPNCNDLKAKKKKLHTQMLDRTLNGLVCAVPKVREQHIRSRVAVIKTLWDISTNLRARRLKSILEATWPELHQP